MIINSRFEGWQKNPQQDLNFPHNAFISSGEVGWVGKGIIKPLK